MNKKIKKSIIMLLILVTTVLTLGMQVYYPRQAYAYYFTYEFSEEARINRATLDNNFTEDEIIVTLTLSASQKFLNYTPADFPEIDVVDIEDLTSFTVNYVEQQIARASCQNSQSRIEDSNVLVDASAFRRILLLRMRNGTREKVLQSIRLLEARDDVWAAEPNYLFSMIGSVEATQKSDSEHKTTSKPVRFDQQWGLHGIHGINTLAAWDITTGCDDIIVGVMDSGIDVTHPDLANAIHISTPTLHRDFTTGVVAGVPIVDHFDETGHGTHVAGIIAGQGVEIFGVARNVRIVSLRVFSTVWNTGALSWYARAVNFAASNGIQILNFSGVDWGSNAIQLNALEAELESFTGSFVTSSGNSGQNNDTGTPMWPTNFSLTNPRVISVGATQSVGGIESRAHFGGTMGSNYGAKSVSIFAPGHNIISTVPVLISDPWGPITTDGYISWNGTSQAAPFVAGTVALMMSINQNINPVQIREILINTAYIPNVNGSNPLQGLSVSNGRLNAHAAVRKASELGIFTIDNNSTITDFTPSINFNGIVNIPYGVTAIAPNAFINQPSITTVHIPASVRTIGADAFRNNTMLSRIFVERTFTLGVQHLTTLGAGALDNTHSNLRIYVPNCSFSVYQERWGSMSSVTINRIHPRNITLTFYRRVYGITVSAGIRIDDEASFVLFRSPSIGIGASEGRFNRTYILLRIPGHITSWAAVSTAMRNATGLIMARANGVDESLTWVISNTPTPVGLWIYLYVIHTGRDVVIGYPTNAIFMVSQFFLHVTVP